MGNSSKKLKPYENLQKESKTSMKKQIIVTAFITSCIAFAQISQADNTTSPDEIDILHKITQVRQALKISASQAEDCTIPTNNTCTFESYCSQFANKGQNFYLYENNEGRKIPNFHMQINLKLAETCMNNPFPQALVSDPFSYPELLEDESVAGSKENQKKHLRLVEKELKRTQDLFKSTKEKVVQLLEKRRTPANKNEIDNMIQRVQRTQFAPPKFGDKIENLAAQGCEMPNAYYQPATNSVTLCPQLLNLPDAAIVSTLAHELAHSIDPCAMTYTYSKDANKKSVLDIPPYLGGPQLNELKPEIKAVFPDQNPLKEVIACLKSPASIGVKTPSQADILATVDKMESALRAEMIMENEQSGELGDATLASFEDQRKVIRSSYPKYQNCSRFTNNGHVQEAFADWLSVEVIGEKISEIKTSEKARQYAFESQAVFFSTGCENIKQATANRIKKATGSHCEMFTEVTEKMKAFQDANVTTHPDTPDRMNKVVLAKPEIKKALGCKDGLNSKACN